MSIFLTVGVLVLIFVSVMMGLLVLMQRSKDGGVGAALAGGAAEAAFGAESNAVLSKTTIRMAVIFFCLAFVLYLGYVFDYHRNHHEVTVPRIGGAAFAPVAAPAAAPVQNPAPAPAPTPEPGK
jgi:preprotein translocase subunit SecG